MSKRKVTFEDGDGEITLEEDVPKKKVCVHVYLSVIFMPTLSVCAFMKIRNDSTFVIFVITVQCYHYL